MKAEAKRRKDELDSFKATQKKSGTKSPAKVEAKILSQAKKGATFSKDGTGTWSDGARFKADKATVQRLAASGRIKLR